ncbi:hypothetical protein [Natrinema salaciae]|uniref:hypothetical protein n=1 Tax=Natrinema salaciae TaxID=1186196 RepID=UPI000B8406D8|nr:hypothetical protein [Natrinema salaciae]
MVADRFDRNGTLEYRPEDTDVVRDVEAGVAWVEPGPEMTDSIKSRPRRDRDVADGMENYRLDEDPVDEVTGDEIRLRRH